MLSYVPALPSYSVEEGNEPLPGVKQGRINLNFLISTNDVAHMPEFFSSYSKREAELIVNHIFENYSMDDDYVRPESILKLDKTLCHPLVSMVCIKNWDCKITDEIFYHLINNGLFLEKRTLDCIASPVIQRWPGYRNWYIFNCMLYYMQKQPKTPENIEIVSKLEDIVFML